VKNPMSGCKRIRHTRRTGTPTSDSKGYLGFSGELAIAEDTYSYLTNDNIHFQGVEFTNQAFMNAFNVSRQDGIGVLGMGGPANEVSVLQEGVLLPTLIDSLYPKGNINRRASSFGSTIVRGFVFRY
jgi:hypothetical protein